MTHPSRKSPPSTLRIWLARSIAVAADLLQMILFPYFAEGLISPANMVLDVAVCITLTLLIGWHVAFIPTFIIEQLPFADLAPTWTLAALIATRKSSMSREAPAQIADQSPAAKS